MSGLDSSWEGGGDSFISFGPHGEWDALHKRLVYVGTTHAAVAPSGNQCREFDYTDSTNTWVRDNTVIPPPGDGQFDHGYYHLACNPATGDLYRKIYGADLVSRRLYGAGSWTSLATPPIDDWGLVVGGLVWHPGLYSGGGGIILATYEGFASWNPATSAWTTLRLSSGTFNGNETNMAAVYNRADACAYFYDEYGSAWKVTATGSVSAVAAPPISPVATGVGVGGHLFSSTGTNRMVIMGTNSSGKTIYEYNHASNSWSSIGTYPFSYSNSFAGFTCNTYNCLVFIMTTSSNTMGTTAYVWKR